MNNSKNSLRCALNRSIRMSIILYTLLLKFRGSSNYSPPCTRLSHLVSNFWRRLSLFFHRLLSNSSTFGDYYFECIHLTTYHIASSGKWFWFGDLVNLVTIANLKPCQYRALVTIITCRREALGLWKSRLGSGATYRALIEVFFKASRLDYADAVGILLKDIISTNSKTI